MTEKSDCRFVFKTTAQKRHVTLEWLFYQRFAHKRYATLERQLPPLKFAFDWPKTGMPFPPLSYSQRWHLPLLNVGLAAHKRPALAWHLPPVNFTFKWPTEGMLCWNGTCSCCHGRHSILEKVGVWCAATIVKASTASKTRVYKRPVVGAQRRGLFPRVQASAMPINKPY